MHVRNRWCASWGQAAGQKGWPEEAHHGTGDATEWSVVTRVSPADPVASGRADRTRYRYRAPGYIPASKPYEMVDLVNDLVMFARYMLVPGGRLVFFLPTFTEEWDPVDLPAIEGMREISFGQGSAQEFNKWSRRLITMEKYSVRDANGEEKKWDAPNFVPLDVEFEEMGLEDDDRGERDEAPRRVAKVPGHANFRERYVAGFPSTPTTPLSED